MTKKMKMKSITALAMSLVVASCFVIYSEGCSCLPSHPQAQFCDADFVIKAKLKGIETLYTKYISKDHETGKMVTNRRPSENRYAIKITKIYKGEEALKNVNPNYLLTALNGAMCGVSLQTKRKYIITGSIRNGQMHTDLCKYNREWTSLNGKEKRSLNSYGKQCEQCVVERCYRPDCPKENVSNVCPWDQQHYAMDCYLEAVCVKQNRKGTCRWAKNPAFRACYKKNKSKYLSEP